MKNNLQKYRNLSYGLNPICKISMKESYSKSYDRIIQKTNDWNKNSPEKLKIYKNNIVEKIEKKRNKRDRKMKETDVSFRLINNPKLPSYHALNGLSKSSSMVDISGTDIYSYKRWNECQLTPKLKWSSIETDHVRPNGLIDVSKDEKLGEALNCKNTQPL